MKHGKKKVILFDIDGTLIRTFGAGTRASNRAFHQAFGVEESWGAIEAAGRTDPLIFNEISLRILGRALKDAEYLNLITLYERFLIEELQRSDSIKILPGIPALLERVCAHPNALVGLQTGNLESCGWAKLRHCKIDHHFAFGGFGIDLLGRETIVARAAEQALTFLQRTAAALDSGQAAFEPSDIVVIGDTPFDIAGGKHFGACTVAVATGIFAVEELEKFSPDAVFSDLSDTEKVIAALGLD